MLTEIEQASINANNQEVLKVKYRDIVLAKSLLYFFFVLFFIVVGVLLGVGTLSYFQEILFQLASKNVSSTSPAFAWTWQSILFYVIVTLTTISAIYLAHRIQSKLSLKSHKNGRRLAWIDWCFTILNFLVFCYGVLFGYVAAMLSISMDNIP